jgi:hypothetical protein
MELQDKLVTINENQVPPHLSMFWSVTTPYSTYNTDPMCIKEALEYCYEEDIKYVHPSTYYTYNDLVAVHDMLCTDTLDETIERHVDITLKQICYPLIMRTNNDDDTSKLDSLREQMVKIIKEYMTSQLFVGPDTNVIVKVDKLNFKDRNDDNDDE